MQKMLREWMLLGALLAQLDALRFEEVLDAIRRIADAETTISETIDYERLEEAALEIGTRFKN